MLSPAARKLLLTAHVTASVGWLGAVMAFLALGLVGLLSRDVARMTGVYVAMDPVTSFVILPLALGGLGTGVIQSLATKWGLIKHYWVLLKLVITVFSTALLLLHTRAIDAVCRAAATAPGNLGDLHGLRVQLVVDAAAAVVALGVATVLGVYKPRGLTRWGRRTQPGSIAGSQLHPSQAERVGDDLDG